VGVVGGSHGGFLGGHLLGQFPSAFRFAVLRNPVTNISLMVGLTDITDWCYVEVGWVRHLFVVVANFPPPPTTTTKCELGRLWQNLSFMCLPTHVTSICRLTSRRSGAARKVCGALQQQLSLRTWNECTECPLWHWLSKSRLEGNFISCVHTRCQRRRVALVLLNV
jgi:hypothetical protein